MKTITLISAYGKASRDKGEAFVRWLITEAGSDRERRLKKIWHRRNRQANRLETALAIRFASLEQVIEDNHAAAVEYIHSLESQRQGVSQ